MEFEIQKITQKNELVACASVLCEAYNSEPWNDQWSIEKATEKLACFFDSPKFYGWMVWLDGRLVGCCVGNIEPYFTGDYFYLKEMFVSPAMQKNGIGKMLMEKVKTEMSLAGIHSMILFTGKDFFPYGFYIKAGFAEMESMRMMHYQKQ